MAVQVGKRIKAVRNQLGLSQAEVTEQLRNRDGSQVSAGYLGNVENGRSNCSVHFLAEVAKALEVNPAEFFREPQALVADELVLELAEERAQEKYGMTLEQVRRVRQMRDHLGLDPEQIRRAIEAGVI